MADKETTSFMRSLCMGRIEQDVLFPFPTFSDAEKEMLADISGALEGLLGPRAEDFREWDVAGELPDDFLDELKEFGMFGLVIPEEYGGMGLGNMAYSRALQQVGNYDASVALTVGAHSSIGMRGLLLFGTEDQNNRYLKKLASGEMIAAYCLTEPGAGSDAAAITTTTMHLDNVEVPDSNVLGEVGRGFKVAMMILNSGRTGVGGAAKFENLSEAIQEQAKIFEEETRYLAQATDKI